MDYAGIRSRAAGQARRAGKLVAIRSPGSSADWQYGYDELGEKWTRLVAPFDTVRTNPIVDVDTPAYAVEFGYEQGERDGTLVRADDRRFLVAGLTSTGAILEAPSPARDKLVVGSVALEIVSTKPVEPGPVAVVYEVQCRG